jgi:hypothetical protein
LFFAPGCRASIQSLCAGDDPAQGWRCAGAARNANPGYKVAPAEFTEPFFVPIVPLAAQFVPNSRCVRPARITDA